MIFIQYNLVSYSPINGFHQEVTTKAPKWQIPLFLLQKWIQLGLFSQVANFWFSGHNFGKVAAIQKFQYFQN